MTIEQIEQERLRFEQDFKKRDEYHPSLLAWNLNRNEYWNHTAHEQFKGWIAAIESRAELDQAKDAVIEASKIIHDDFHK